MQRDLNGFLTDPWPQLVRHPDLHPPSGATLPEIAAVTLVVLDASGSGHSVMSVVDQKKDSLKDGRLTGNPL